MNCDIRILEKKIEILKDNYQKFKEHNKIDEDILRENICDVLSWIEICSKDDSKYTEKDLGKLRAFKYVNNKKKHSNTVEKYNIYSTALFPSDDLYPSETLYPSDFEIKWSEIALDETGFKSQYNNYIKYLKGKDIITTIDEIYNVIKSYF